MELHARLVHAEAGRRVVQVSARRGDRSLGSALGEGASAEEAEDRARGRLLAWLEGAPSAVAPRQPRRSADTAGPADAGRAQVSAPLPPSSDGMEPPGSPASPGVDPEASRTAGRSDASVPAVSAAAPSEGIGPAGPQPPGPAAPLRRAAGVVPAAEPPAAAASSGDPVAGTETVQTPAGAAAGGIAAAMGGALGPQPIAGDGSVEAGGALPLRDPVEEPPADPEDWSQELVALDLELRRLGWGRAEEGIYLQRAFGHPSRSRLTRYSDLRAYLAALGGLERGSDPAVAAVPLRRGELLAQGELLLGRLGWSAEQGRAFLERELQRQSRSQLSDVQLLQFNMLLEGELLAGGAAAGIPGRPDGASQADRAESQR